MTGTNFVFFTVAVITLISNEAGACVRGDWKGDGSANIKFTNNCPYAVEVSWWCSAGTCNGSNTCLTNPVQPGSFTYGWCSKGRFFFNYKKFP